MAFSPYGLMVIVVTGLCGRANWMLTVAVPVADADAIVTRGDEGALRTHRRNLGPNGHDLRNDRTTTRLFQAHSHISKCFVSASSLFSIER